MIDKRYNRVLTLKDLILLGLSMTIGTGIFVLIDDVAKYAKNLAWFSMLIAGGLSLLTALSYGELASIFRNNMGEYGFIRSVANDKIANIVGLCTLLSDIFVISTISLGLGNYVSSITGYNVQLIATLAISILNYINYCGITTSKNVSNCILYAKIMVMFAIIILSFTKYSPSENLFSTQSVDHFGISNAALIALFAYIGFNNMTNFAEETIEPEVNIGKAIMYTVMIAAVLYTLITFAALFTLGSNGLSQTATPLASVMDKIFGHYGFIFVVILAIISITDTLLVSSVSESRYIHAFLSNLFPQYGQQDMDHKTRTPYLSIILLVVLSIAVIYLFTNIESTAIYGDLIMMFIFIIVNIIVIILRYKWPDEPRKFKVPFNLGKIPLPSVLAIIVGLYSIYQYIQHIFM